MYILFAGRLPFRMSGRDEFAINNMTIYESHEGLNLTEQENCTNCFNVTIDESYDGQDAMFEYVTEGVLLTLVSILGLIGNILSIYVLLRPSVRGVFSTILTGLASFDALFLAVAPFTFGLPILSSFYRVCYMHICH